MSNLDKGSYVLSKHTGVSQQYHWVLRASNNEVILTSESYVVEPEKAKNITNYSLLSL